MIAANDPALRSWVDVPAESDFPIQNLPFGIVRPADGEPRVAVRIGDMALDLAALHAAGLLNPAEFEAEDFATNSLNRILAKDKSAWRRLRDRVSTLLRHDNPSLRDNEHLRAAGLIPVSDLEMLMPVEVGDYTDFYSSIEHATNVGIMFRDPENALLPNWKHLPVGYHGRASSIIVSGQDVRRPVGQTRPNDSEPPQFGPTRLLDFELEMAFITGAGKELGQRITSTEADDYIFGMVLFNDWSARDIQKWEYVPLGPFLAKSFASSISAWVVTLDALEPFRVAGPEQNPPVQPYLHTQGDKNIDIDLEVFIESETFPAHRVSHSNFKYMYWNMAQQLTHQTVNGCNVRAGDMYASGTISGPTPDSYGSMLEITWRGSKPVDMPDGTQRKFINDHDTVIMRGTCRKGDVRIGFGEVRASVLPALEV